MRLCDVLLKWSEGKCRFVHGLNRHVVVRRPGWRGLVENGTLTNHKSSVYDIRFPEVRTNLNFSSRLRLPFVDHFVGFHVDFYGR